MHHHPVLLQEVVEIFKNCELTQFVDGTAGAGGHAAALLEAHPEIEVYIAIDQDTTALTLASNHLAQWKEKTIFIHGNFADFDHYLKKQGITKVNGILVDLGVSSMQLDQAERGFSFSKMGPLDMRMNQQGAVTAADIVNTWSEEELGALFRDYGEEKRWRIAARAIAVARSRAPILTTQDLVDVLKPALPWNPKKGINPLTLVFQALRICVNRELEVLNTFLPKAIDTLAPAGRLAVISFHSLEDRIVKQQMRFAASDKWDTAGIGGMFLDKDPLVTLKPRKPIIASDIEVKENPRSRSAKLRCVEKLPINIV